MNRRNNRRLRFTISGFIAFFLTLSLTISTSILLYDHVSLISNGNKAAIAFSVLGNIIFGTIICAIIDFFRRKYMVDKPAQSILDATEKIANGDFDISLDIKRPFHKYDEYDLIKDNINKIAEELKKNELLKTDFISNVSHEIKTPITIIQNYVKLLQDENLDKEQRKKYLVGLSSATQKLSNLITNILKLNKLENQEIVPEIEKIDLAENLRQCVLNFENLIEKKGLKLVCDIDEITINSNASYLELIWNNLISNAIKFTEQGGQIEISLKREGAYVCVKVADNGCGISRESGKHIFDKFYQGDTSHSGEGNGLGLALVKKVIDKLGGQITVESQLGKGSTFTVKLKE